MNNTPDFKSLKLLVAQNKIQKVVDDLVRFAPTLEDEELSNEILLLSAQWQNLTRNKRLRTLSDDQLQLAHNRITDSLLALLDQLEEQPQPTATKVNTNQSTNTAAAANNTYSLKNILAAIAATIAVLAGIAEISGYSMRDWWAQPKQEIAASSDNKEADQDKEIINPPTASTSNPVKEKTKPENTPTKSKTPPSRAAQQTTKPKPQLVPPPAEDTLPPPKEKLQLAIQTNKGTKDLIFKEDEEVRLYFKVNKPCQLRTIYQFADSTLLLLDKDKEVNEPETNKWVELSDGFEVAAPFGIENLYVFAQEMDFPELVVEQIDGYTYIKDGLLTALSKTRGLKKKQVFAESKLTITTQENK